MACFISLRTQYENIGDEIINSLLIRELAKRDEVIALADGVPDWYVGNIKTQLGSFTIRTCSSLYFYKRILLGDEHSLLFTSPGDVTDRRLINIKDIALVLLSASRGVNIAQVGASAEHVSPTKRLLFRYLLSSDRSAISVRDARSANVLHANGLRVPVVPDLAFLLGTSKPSSGTKRVILSFRCRSSEEAEAIHSVLDGVIPRLQPEYEFVATAQVARDLSFNLDIAKRHHLRFLDVLNPSSNRIDRLLNLYKSGTAVFSNRLHALLIGASQGSFPVPVLSQSESKVRGVMEWAGLRIANLDGLAADRIEALLVERSDMIPTIPKRFSDAADRINLWLDSVVGPIRKRLDEH